MQDVMLRVRPEEVPFVQEMFRQQLLGDRELLADTIAGREDPERRIEIAERLACVRRMAEQVGVKPLPPKGAFPIGRVLTALTLLRWMVTRL